MQPLTRALELTRRLTTAPPRLRARGAASSILRYARPLREGLADLEIGVMGQAGPEFRVQAIYHDHFVGVVRAGHPLLNGPVTPERYVAFGHVVTSRRGRPQGPVDEALAALGLQRDIRVVVPGFPAALAIARASDLIALAPRSFLRGGTAAAEQGASAFHAFDLPVSTPGITISQLWHPRLDADPAHRWLRALTREICQQRDAIQGE